MADDQRFQWSNITRKIGPTACVLSVAAVLIVAALQTDSEKPGVQATPVDNGEEAQFQKLTADGNRAFQNKNWDLSIAIYEKIVREYPDDPAAWFRLGYCLHITGKYDAALDAYKHAEEMPTLKPVVYYNMACAYALKNMKKESLTCLRKSIDAGFRTPQRIAEDPDFAAYLDDPEFQKIVGNSISSDNARAYRQFDFWIGKWDVHDASGKKVGVNEITQSENGYVLTEKWHSRHAHSSGTSINYFDPRSRQWKQVWVDARGGIIRYSGAFKDGKMRFKGDFYDRNGKRGIARATFTPLKDGRVHQLIQHSTDRGKTWTVHFNGYYTRRYSTL